MEEAHRLKSIYADQVALLVGLETEYITTLDLENLSKMLERLGERVEYIVGSVHHVNGIPIDFDLPTYQMALSSFADEKEEDRQGDEWHDSGGCWEGEVGGTERGSGG